MRQRVLMIGCLAAGLAFAQPEVGELDRGIVKITVHKPDGTAETGAGLIVAVDGDTALVVTAHHVIAEAKAVEVVLFAKQYAEFPAKPFRRFHEDLDLGLLTVALPHELAVHLEQPFPIADSGGMREGDKLIIIGHPRDLEWQSSMNVNTVTGLSEREDSRRFRLTKTALAQGNSGGGVFKEDGSLLGLVTKLSPEYAVAVKVDALLFVLRQEWGIATWWRTDDARAALARELAGHAVAMRNEVESRTPDELKLSWTELLQHKERRALLERSVLLAVESVRRSRTPEGEQALRDGLAWLTRPVAALHQHSRVKDLSFSPDGKYLIALGYADVQVWDVATGREVVRIQPGEPVKGIVISHTGRYLVTMCEKSAVVWGLRGGAQTRLPRSEQWNSYMAVFSPDDKLIATRSPERVVRIWETATGRSVAALEHPGRVDSVFFTPGGREVITIFGHSDGTGPKMPWVWDIASGRQTRWIDHQDANTIAFSPDGKYLATSYGGVEFKIWSASDYSLVANLSAGRNVEHLVFSPDGRHLVIGTSGLSVDSGTALLDVGTWRTLRTLGPGGLESASFTAEKIYLALKDSRVDQSVRVWDGITGREVGRFIHDERCHLSHCVLSPDGRCAATFDPESFSVMLWPLDIRDPIGEACERLRRNLTPEEWRRYLGREPYRRTCANLP